MTEVNLLYVHRRMITPRKVKRESCLNPKVHLLLVFLSSMSLFMIVKNHMFEIAQVETKYLRRTSHPIATGIYSDIPEENLVSWQNLDHFHENGGPGIVSGMKEIKSSDASKYDKVWIWDVSPLIDFSQNPYFKFCQWRNGNIKKKKQIEGLWSLHEHNSTYSPLNRTLLHVRFQCFQTMRESSLGTGNWVQAIYLLRLASAREEGVPMDLRLSCVDDSNQNQLVLPWLMGNFSSEQTTAVLQKYFTNFTIPRCYGEWSNNSLGFMTPFIRQELRRMAVSLIGIPESTHPAQKWLEMKTNKYSASIPNKPLIPGVQIDDVAIHFRCGDTMFSRKPYFRFLKFHDFASRIPLDVESIGIITQPFQKTDESRTRDLDDAFRSKVCQRVILGFETYLRDLFPHSRISIHNNANETIALAFARLVMARRQAFAFPDSSFSVFPALASFGMSYHLHPIASPYLNAPPKNYFLHRVFPYIRNGSEGQSEWMNISTSESLFSVETFMMKQNLKNVSDAIFEWFVNSTSSKLEFGFDSL